MGAIRTQNPIIATVTSKAFLSKSGGADYITSYDRTGIITDSS